MRTLGVAFLGLRQTDGLVLAGLRVRRALSGVGLGLLARCEPIGLRGALSAWSSFQTPARNIVRRLKNCSPRGRHEDISRVLERLGGPGVVDDLEFLAWAGTEFQNHEGSTSLAKKAVHSLERVEARLGS